MRCRKEKLIGKIFSEEEIRHAYVICLDRYDPQKALGEKGEGEGAKGISKGKGKSKDTIEDVRKQGIVEHHGVMIMYKK